MRRASGASIPRSRIIFMCVGPTSRPASSARSSRNIFSSAATSGKRFRSMREQRIQLGLLDFSWVNGNHSPLQALKDTVAVAQRAETLGYARYWLGEHHVEGHACGSPQILATLLAASTKRIRIGIGAMLLHYWAP